ncbi:hypothetical protein P153DRAFT_391357 [Dothidotthia symphoricarpi CBS 119687]|uniref:C2H2-type domain-containing protein n=1 Tax=Dothidotthia symphoricarpi CBS 119687 TaxID=1392245 RepID=A0A6A5ZVL1_9PLEO|nr:uncharacterized protein P153DRAFT_391357 [Dothidotthia symphoricarpi CBS 119687]KAF2123630.1 hypothetical protein P153DRAFT_391357 [Dothidotthia symphoricarpi CBS 119687]
MTPSSPPPTSTSKANLHCATCSRKYTILQHFATHLARNNHKPVPASVGERLLNLHYQTLEEGKGGDETGWWMDALSMWKDALSMGMDALSMGMDVLSMGMDVLSMGMDVLRMGMPKVWTGVLGIWEVVCHIMRTREGGVNWWVVGLVLVLMFPWVLKGWCWAFCMQISDR